VKALVRVEDDWMRDKVAVLLANADNSFIEVFDFTRVAITRSERDAREVDGIEPLRLSHDMARALYEALAKHFGGAPETATLRQDYEAERARVDVFIRHLTTPTP
jgi:hypothetical protein